MIRTASAAALLTALSLGSIISVAPAQARLTGPDTGSVIGGGLFGGVRLGPRSARLRADERASELIGENCYLLKERVARQSGGVAIARTQVCE
jgi:hypothetical protein